MLTLLLPLPPQEGEHVYQKNEGQWDFSLDEDEDGRCIVLEVEVGKYLDTSLLKVRRERRRNECAAAEG